MERIRLFVLQGLKQGGKTAYLYDH